jgi:protein SCO1/2
MRRSLVAAILRPLVAAAGPLAPLGAVAAPREPAVPNIPLTTHDGVRVKLYDDLVKGRVVLINFMFTTCRSVCPRATENLARVAEGLGDRLEREVRLISVTVDPRRDTPPVLKKYASRFSAPAGWYFVTGDEKDIDVLRDGLGVNADGAGRNDHTGMVIYGNERTDQWAMTPVVTNYKTILWSVTGLLRDR